MNNDVKLEYKIRFLIILKPTTGLLQEIRQKFVLTVPLMPSGI